MLRNSLAPLLPDRIQGRLLTLAGIFLGLYSLALTLSPAARARSWDVEYRWNHWPAFFVWLILFFIAHWQTERFLPKRDPYLLPVAALLSGWGMLTIWRLTPAFGLRQTLWLVVATVVLILGLRLPNHLAFLRRYKYLWLTGGLFLTLMTLLLGTNPASGSSPRLWLGCCGVYFQPSEPLKLLLIVYLAAYFADHQPVLRVSWSKRGDDAESAEASASQPSRSPSALLALLAPTIFMTGLTILLLLVQRDLGTATIFIVLFAAITYVATGRVFILVVSAVTLCVAGVAGNFLFEVVRLRVDAWLNPWLDPSGGSYQIVQSLLAVANGGLVGRGPGLGYPTLVPISHSDFIFAAILEESGLAGAIGLIALLMLIATSGLRIALNAPDFFRRYLAAGLTAYLVSQSVLIAGGNLRLLPLTGVTLPFVSYGGSSLLTAFISLLLLLKISQSAKTDPALLADSKSHLSLAGFLYGGLAAVALVTGWWAFWRGPALLERTDNPRRSIADRYVHRGALLDRHNKPLAATDGDPGEFTRQFLYPPLSPVIGYTHPVYGQSGLEASLDPYLRGIQGNPGLSVWWNHLLYGQPPPGLDVRLSLDMDLQRTADELLGDHAGALVLLNAQSGEVLVMASHPTFDPNQLDAEWAGLVANPDTPLLNRATQGLYQISDALGSLLEVAVPDLSNSTASPLQIALAAAALSADGVRPAPQLAMAVNTPQTGWTVMQPEGETEQVLSASSVHGITSSLFVEGLPIWQTTDIAPGGPEGAITWYLGGTQPSWGGAPLALVVLLEEEDLTLAEAIGQAMLKATLITE